MHAIRSLVLGTLALGVLASPSTGQSPGGGRVEAQQSTDTSTAGEAVTSSPPGSSATVEQENLFWQSIMRSTNRADFQAYLQQFPSGVFRRLAQNRLTALPMPSDRPPAVADRDAAPSGEESPVAFGEDMTDWANDGECDDPRFDGDGMALALTFENRGRDASDCRALYNAGLIHLFGIDLDLGDVDFGDDSSRWARDNECDDPRFAGDGMDPLPLPGDRGRDASDCRTLYKAGRVHLFGVSINATQ